MGARKGWSLMVGLSVLLTFAVVQPVYGACSGGSGGASWRYGQWGFNAESGVNLIGASSDLRLVRPYVPTGAAPSEIVLEIANGRALAYVGYEETGSSEIGIWYVSDANGGFLASGSWSITDTRGSWYTFKITKSGSTWQFYYKGSLKGSGTSSWTGNHADISLIIQDNHSQFWGKTTYHWSSKNSTYTSQYGTAGFGIASISWLSKLSTMNASEISSELEAWDSDSTCG